MKQISIETILENNKRIKAEIKAVNKEAHDKIVKLEHEIIPPCMECSYDGVYRCETCAENYYEGYNIKEYPNETFEFEEGNENEE